MPTDGRRCQACGCEAGHLHEADCDRTLDPYDRVPLVEPAVTFPEAREQVWDVLRHGARKHGPDDFWKSMPVESHVRHAQTHIAAHLGGSDGDPDSALPHLAHAATRLLMALELS